MRKKQKNDNMLRTFVDWFGMSLEIGDCDPSIWMTNYFFDRFEYNKEQRLWLTWIYGTTYYWPTTYVIWNEFPDMHLVGLDRLTAWNDENYNRLRYQVDTKWNKGHLPAQFESYRDWVGDRSQHEAITDGFVGNEVEDFNTLWQNVNKIHKFGRYSSWFYIQTLKQCCRIPVDAGSLWFGDYSGSRSHRNGMCYAAGKEEWIDQRLDEKQVNYLESLAKDLLKETKIKYPHVAAEADLFSMETALCSFKKVFRNRKTRYIGYYLDRQLTEIQKVEADGWIGIDWKPMYDARNETIDARALIPFNADEQDLETPVKLLYPWDRRKQQNESPLEQFFI